MSGSPGTPPPGGGTPILGGWVPAGPPPKLKKKPGWMMVPKLFSFWVLPPRALASPGHAEVGRPGRRPAPPRRSAGARPLHPVRPALCKNSAYREKIFHLKSGMFSHQRRGWQHHRRFRVFFLYTEPLTVCSFVFSNVFRFVHLCEKWTKMRHGKNGSQNPFSDIFF